MKKICAVSGTEFEISDEDVQFYEKLGVPTPTLCPEERDRRRLAWRNERKLYWRICDGTGKKILSVFHQSSPLKVYDPEYWYSDAWDAMEHGRDFDFSRPFFEQFNELIQSVPQVGRSVVKNQNCDFVNQCGLCKNCYLIFEAVGNENCLYCEYVNYCRSCMNCTRIEKCELCFECIECVNCYESLFLQNCQNCTASWFLKNCIGCSNCFGCINLRNKQYYFLNEKCTPEEYQEKIKNWHLEKYSKISDLQIHFVKFCEKFPHKFQQGILNENSSGDSLDHTQRCKECFAVKNSQDCAWMFNCTNMRNCYDITVFGTEAGADWCYECHEIGQGVQNVCFSDQVWMSSYDIWYSKLCTMNCKNLFGCCGLRHKEYCIFNKQYSKEEYFALREKIVTHMKKTREWGEFFPLEMSPFAYNETLAQDYFPLEEKSAIDAGLQWRKNDAHEFQKQSFHIPDTIAEIDETICNEILACEACGKNFKIQKAELSFLKTAQLPLPHHCPDCRYNRRMKLRNPKKLWHRKCDKCGIEIQTTFAPERPEKVYCEKCYLDAVE